MNDPSQMRISHEDRHKVSELLREAAGEGRLEPDELDERLEAAYAAKIYADLVPIVADLPGAGPAVPAVPAVPASAPLRPTSSGGALTPATRYDSSFSIMGSQSRQGVWEIGAAHTAFTLMGGVDLDLRQTHFTAPETVINANAVMGGIDIVVNQWTRVSVEGVGVMGDFSQLKDKVEVEVHPNSPLVRVKGIALMGAVNVRRKPMPGKGPAKRWLKHLGF